jgi:hypothetical protein
VGSIWPYQFGSQRNIEQAEAKTTTDKTIQNRTEPAFIQPMQCKSVTALPAVTAPPAGEKWTLEIKFAGYRGVIVKRSSEVTVFSRNQKVLNRRFPKVVDAIASLGGDFVLDGNVSLRIHKVCLNSNLYKTILRRIFRFIFTPSIYCTKMGELLLSLSIERRQDQPSQH